MVSKACEKETCGALDERWRKDWNDFIAPLLDDLGRGRVLTRAGAEVSLRNEDSQTCGLHPLNHVHAKILKIVRTWKLHQIGSGILLLIIFGTLFNIFKL